MSAEMPKAVAASSSQVAKRMRLYRKRWRQGLRLVRIPLRVTEIDDFIRMGLLDEEHRDSPEALQAVVLNLLHQALDEMRDAPWLRVKARHLPRHGYAATCEAAMTAFAKSWREE
jgi:hypothetical protein